MNIRDNLLVTIGSRAAYMDAGGDIDLPGGSIGEDVLAKFASKLADQWIEEELDMSFDEFIETALEKRFPADWKKEARGC